MPTVIPAPSIVISALLIVIPVLFFIIPALFLIIPAKAGIQGRILKHRPLSKSPWMCGRPSKLRFPVYTGMTKRAPIQAHIPKRHLLNKTAQRPCCCLRATPA
ncbi:MAG: hypothetical protein LBE78_08465 [Burkholderiaceae bacterium]|jgi:hypothetical protein|nr:hypothetical protein [Burkholderiaceae bacterium]